MSPTSISAIILFLASFSFAQTTAKVFEGSIPSSIRAGSPLTVRWHAKDGPVTVYLVANPTSSSLTTFSTLTQATGDSGSVVWTPSTNLPNGPNYAYKLADGGNSIFYSPKFALSGGSAAVECSWAGHCAGAPCNNDIDCSDNLTCQGKICAAVSAVPVQPSAASSTSCAWPGHCAGAACESENDCSGDLFCLNKVCTDGSSLNAAGTTSGSSPTPATTPSSQGSKTPVGAIVGGVIGGLALIAAVVIAALFLFKRKPRAQEEEAPRPPPAGAPEPDYFSGLHQPKAELEGTSSVPASPYHKPPATPPVTNITNIGTVHELA